MHTYWKIHFDETNELGWLVFDTSTMVALRITDELGNEIKDGVSYTPFEFTTYPDWANI